MLKKLLITVIMAAALSFTASAGFESTDSVEYIPIAGNSFAVDELDGVPALYNAYDNYYQCSEYVQRYYSQVYGIEMDFSSSGPNIKTEGYYFETVSDEPRRGDVAYIPAYNRGKSYGHWAIVKEYGDGTVTLIEQNWRWGSMAAYERKISWPSGSYIFYRLTDGEASSFPSCWAKDSVERCKELSIGDGLYGNLRAPVSRLDFCTMLMTTIQQLSPELQHNDSLFLFADTASSAVSKAVSMGIVAENDLFRPNDSITRQEAAVMMNGAVAALGLSVSGSDGESMVDDAVSDWAAEAVENMLSMYFFVGSDNGFMPQETIEVQHACVLMMYLYDYAEKYEVHSPVTAADITPALACFYAWEEFFKNNG